MTHENTVNKLSQQIYDVSTTDKVGQHLIIITPITLRPSTTEKLRILTSEVRRPLCSGIVAIGRARQCVTFTHRHIFHVMKLENKFLRKVSHSNAHRHIARTYAVRSTRLSEGRADACKRNDAQRRLHAGRITSSATKNFSTCVTRSLHGGDTVNTCSRSHSRSCHLLYSRRHLLHANRNIIYCLSIFPFSTWQMTVIMSATVGSCSR